MWGTPAVDMFVTVHSTHLPQLMSPVPEHQALAIDALTQDWQGRSMYRFPPFPLLSKVIQKLRSTQESVTDSPLVAITTVISTSSTSVCGPSSLLSVPMGPTVTTGICLGREFIPSARMGALMQHYQAAGFSKEVSRLAAAPRRPSTNRMYEDRWLLFANCAAGQGIDPLGPTAAQLAAFLFYFF